MERQKNTLLGKLINNRWKVFVELGSGSQGTVYKALDHLINTEVAVKAEPILSKVKSLEKEYSLYRKLSDHEENDVCGLPTVIFFGNFETFHVMVMELLGPSLNELFCFERNEFSPKTCLLLFIKLLSCIETIHKKGIIHRDIKPENICMGRGEHACTVYLIDFGVGTEYIKQPENLHVPISFGNPFTGTFRYASLSAHEGKRQSRKDDLEALGFVIMALFKRGKLPWLSLEKTKDEAESWKKIREWKGMPTKIICHGYPSVFHSYLDYCRNLRYEEEPSYERLRKMVRSYFEKRGFEWDDSFDWFFSENGSDLSSSEGTFNKRYDEIVALNRSNSDMTRSEMPSENKNMRAVKSDLHQNRRDSRDSLKLQHQATVAGNEFRSRLTENEEFGNFRNSYVHSLREHVDEKMMSSTPTSGTKQKNRKAKSKRLKQIFTSLFRYRR